MNFIPDALARLLGIQRWAASTLVTALLGLMVAGQGFYRDVAWHIARGRDDQLFTSPHTSIVIGLGLIALSSAVGILVATSDRVETRLRWGGLRVPWSALLLGLLGMSALSGFPIDELWHRAYGVDVTMWSPTHMLMIVGAATTGAASWLVLAEAGVPVRGRRRHRALHVVAAWFMLKGLTAPLGEFSFGVPQFNQLFHPLLLCLAAGLAIVPMRLALGRGWALGIVTGSLLIDQTNVLSGGGELPVEPRAAGLYLASAVVVEVVAALAGTRNRTRFAVLAGAGIGTIGLAGEWAWNTGANQPWRAALLPEALVGGVVVAVAAALLGTAFAGAFTGAGRAPVRGRWLLVSTVVLLLALAYPMPRHVGDVHADVTLEAAGNGEVLVHARLTPADAADGARWFQAGSWQGGDLVLADMEETSPGVWASERPIPVGGGNKSLLRLHRAHEMMTVPVYLPADAEIGEPEVPAVDRSVPFASERDYLLRETKKGDALLAMIINPLLIAMALVWMATFATVVAQVTRRHDQPSDDQDGSDQDGSNQDGSEPPAASQRPMTASASLGL